MLNNFLRGRLYNLINTSQKKEKLDPRSIRPKTIKLSSRISRIKSAIKNAVKKSNLFLGSRRRLKTLSIHKPRRYLKCSKRSFAKRFLFPIKRPLYKKARFFNARLPVDFQEENTLFIDLKGDMKKQEFFFQLNNRWKKNVNKFTLLSYRAFLFGRVYVSNKRRNTFITITKAIEDSKKLLEKVAYKSSCGLQSFTGPKRKTYHARLSVAEAARDFLAEKEYTSIDIIFSSGKNRILRKLYKILKKKHIAIRYLVAPKRRAHGITRRKKPRRL